MCIFYLMKLCRIITVMWLTRKHLTGVILKADFNGRKLFFDNYHSNI